MTFRDETTGQAPTSLAKGLSLAAPSRSHGDGLTLREVLRAGVVAGYESLRLPAPRETRDPLWAGWAALASWVGEKARLTGADDRATARHLVRCFLRSKNARKLGWPIRFLVENGNEFWSDELPAEVA